MEKTNSTSCEGSLDQSGLLLAASDAQSLNEGEEGQERCRPRSEATQNLRLIINTVVITLIVLTALQQLYHHLTFSPDKIFHSALASVYSERKRLTPLYHCGNSPTEAIAQDCVFDISLVGWVPKPCFDADLNQRFLDSGWRFYEDEEGTSEVSLDRLAASAGTREPFWAQHGFHITHCELAWERMHRAIMTGQQLTTHMLNLEHTRHCGKMHELRVPLQKLNSQIMPMLNTC